MSKVKYNIAIDTWRGTLDSRKTGQAKLLIDIQRERSIQEIAYMLGFSEPSSFHHFFKRVIGMTAKDYRNQLSTRYRF